MPEENYGFAQTRARLDDIVAQVRKKDVSLEKSLDLLEEGVRLANQCTELIDHADWEAAEATGSGASGEEPSAAATDPDAGERDDAGDAVGERVDDAAHGPAAPGTGDGSEGIGEAR